MFPIETGRVLIAGAGLAAQYAALKLAPRPVLMISPEALGRGASSAWAQGGVAAAMDPADSADAHARDAVTAGAGTVDPGVASSVTAEARDHILDLTGLGTPFDRTAGGAYVLSREAAHSFARVVRVRGDQAGAEIMRALTVQVHEAEHIQVLEGVMATGLEVSDGHVTGVAVARCDQGQSVSVTLRGEGAVLVNRHGERFMLDAHPDAELAPRDIVARAVYAQTQQGLAPALDTRAALGAKILTDFPAVAAACQQAGLDPLTQVIPVAAAAHYHMGGVATDAQGASSLPGLWACGEVASTGLHGANRLASNGLLETLVYCRRCALAIGAALPAPGDEPQVTLPDLGPGESPDPTLVTRLRQAMTDGAGVIRTSRGLTRTLADIAAIEAAQPGCETLKNMTATATLIAAAALMRRESRGAHFRSDFPQPDGAIGTRSRMTLHDALAIRDTTTRKEPA